MSNEISDAEKLRKKYHKTEEIKTLKEMLYRSGDIYRSRIAFKLKDEKGNKGLLCGIGNAKNQERKRTEL